MAPLSPNTEPKGLSGKDQAIEAAQWRCLGRQPTPLTTQVERVTKRMSKSSKRPRRAEKSGAAVKRPWPSDGSVKRPGRIATPATAEKRPRALASSPDRNHDKRLRACSDAGRTSADKTPSKKTSLVRPPPLHGRPPPDKPVKMARLQCRPSLATCSVPKTTTHDVKPSS